MSREADTAKNALAEAGFAIDDMDTEIDGLKEDLEDSEETVKELRATLVNVGNSALITRLQKLESIIQQMRIELEDAALEGENGN